MHAGCVNIVKSFPPILAGAIVDVIARFVYNFLVNNNNQNTPFFAIKNLLFLLLLCSPSIFLIFALVKGKFGLAFLWPMASALLWAIANHVLLCMVIVEDKRASDLASFNLLCQCLFYTGYALAIGKHWKDQLDAKSRMESSNVINEIGAPIIPA